MNTSSAESFPETQQTVPSSTDLLQHLEAPSPSVDPSTTGLSFTETVSLLTTNSFLTRSLLGRHKIKHKEASVLRRKREFIPDEKKDDSYWDKRKKNNEAAKRSREKRRVNDMVLENRVIALLEENARLKTEVLALKLRFGVKETSETQILPTGPQTSRFTTTPQMNFLARADNSFSLQAGDNREFLSNMQNFGRVGQTHESFSLSEDSGFSTPGSSNTGSPVFFDDQMSDQGKFSPDLEDNSFDNHLVTSSDTEGEVGRTSPSDSTKTGKADSMESVKSLPHKLRFKMAIGVEEAGQEMYLKRNKMGHESLQRLGHIQHTSDFHPNGHFSNSQTQTLERGMSAGVVSPPWQAHMPQESCSGQQTQCLEDTPRFTAHRSSELQQLESTIALPQQGSFHQSENVMLKNQLTSLCAEVAHLKKLFSEQILFKTN
ncbi:nuclear factor, interleukin 3 regulated, member 6 [Latimeria chalumnae]|uniref:nuclear factor, interleukin 3 regulated, member 6 n=1 Tax=Latimeria chalumnae TaxID=7897 RepID=UPI0003C17F50|nr:PREDICTED: nuclear factor interleukin-3-regulated protein-like [Latimeria chalumnae]XP_014349490.1 PREDICTED: nuclear factor interleukin-3-regulated protein-like [Latimeria chalumnae]|eukprot:XP_006005228.1 PREDICTED: nuclear factor interleukin-3-regulated protein-like [Latimeria chalumnae]